MLSFDSINVRQIKRSVAERIGLKTHEKLIGQSTLGNGSVLYCYLSKVSINIGSDCRMELVVKVVDDHCPNLLELDVLVASGNNPNYPSNKQYQDCL